MVQPVHLRKARMCASGARQWCERYGLDWRALFQEGLPVEDVEATGDALGLQVAAVAREEANGVGRGQ